MRRINSSFMFMILLLLLMGLLVFGTISFFTGMNRQYILIHQGIQPVRHVINHHRYLQHKRGLVFSLTFLGMGLSFFIMVVLPSDEKPVRDRLPTPIPEPVRPVGEESGLSAVVEQTPPEPIPAMEKEEVPVIQIDTITGEETIEADIIDVKEGEDDVVYGNGPISDAAIIHFVHKYPDSALKYLFRRQLDGKPLTTTEEEIYQGWEKRQMTRGKVKSYIQTMMDWKSFPKKPLYELWKEIRDHIFENLNL
jgi:hypothetical protein